MCAYRAVYLWEAQHGVAQGQSSRGRSPLSGDRRGAPEGTPLLKNGAEVRGRCPLNGDGEREGPGRDWSQYYEGGWKGGGKPVGVDYQEAVAAGHGEEGGYDAPELFGAAVTIADDEGRVDGEATRTVGPPECGGDDIGMGVAMVFSDGEHQKGRVASGTVKKVGFKKRGGVGTFGGYDYCGAVVAEAAVFLQGGYDGALGGGKCPTEPALEMIVPRG